MFALIFIAFSREIKTSYGN